MELKPGRRGFQAGPTSNKKEVGIMGERMIPIGNRNGRQYAVRRDW